MILENVRQMTNAEFGALLPKGNCSLLVRHAINGIEWYSSFAGMRHDHYDTTPTTPKDAANMLRANGGKQDWIAMPVHIRLPNGTWVPFGYVPRMHGSFIGGANPGAPFRSLSNVLPAGQSWPENGGHCCAYPINGTGGTTSATTLPSSNNRKVSTLANQRALSPVARGAMSRAAAQEALIRSGTSQVPPAQMPNVTVNYQVKVTGSTVNIRAEPTTNSKIIKSVTAGTRLNIDRTQTGLDAQVNNPNALWRRIADGEFKGRWIIGRFTEQIAASPPTVQPPSGSWSVQCVAAHDSVYIDNIIARLRGMGYSNAFRTKSPNGWYQARVPAGTEQQARALFPTLRDKGFKDAFPVLCA